MQDFESPKRFRSILGQAIGERRKGKIKMKPLYLLSSKNDVGMVFVSDSGEMITEGATILPCYKVEFDFNGEEISKIHYINPLTFQHLETVSINNNDSCGHFFWSSSKEMIKNKIKEREEAALKAKAMMDEFEQELGKTKKSIIEHAKPRNSTLGNLVQFPFSTKKDN